MVAGWTSTTRFIRFTLSVSNSAGPPFTTSVADVAVVLMTSLPTPVSRVICSSRPSRPAARVTVSTPPRVVSWMRSIVPRSITIAATSRVKETRAPFGKMEMFSLAFEPLNSSVSVPVCPSMTSLPVARRPGHAIVPAPAGDRVVALVAGQDVVAGAARERVHADAAENRVVAVPAAQQVVAAAAVDLIVAAAALQVVREEIRGGAADDAIVAGAAHDAVGPVAGVHVERGQRGQARVGHEVVVAGEHRELEDFGPGDVHQNRRHVTGQQRACPVRCQRVVLGGVAAVELQRVGPGLPLDNVAAVAGVPDEPVVAVAAEHHVVADPRVDRVVAGPAQDDLGADSPRDRVVAVAAGDGSRLRVGEGAVDLVDQHGVVSAARVDGDRREEAAQEIADGRGALKHFDAGGIRRHQAHGDRVGSRVARDAQLGADDRGGYRGVGRYGGGSQEEERGGRATEETIRLQRCGHGGDPELLGTTGNRHTPSSTLEPG